MKNEKLLLLGIDTATRFILEDARKKGIYTIITDPRDLSMAPLKASADEGWDLDVGDLDGLEKKCRESGVTAVMAGNHEFCLDHTKKLAKRLGLPFYAGDTCWSIARNKLRFKQMCLESGLKVAKDYQPGDAICYPVIVKPSDSSASRGITEVYEEKNLQAACEKALSFSDNKKLVIEQLLRGREIMFTGYMDQDQYHILMVGEILTVSCAGRECLSFAPHSPKRAAWLMEKYGKNIRTLFEKMDFHNGLFILQGFMEEDGDFYLFESGIRFDGGFTPYLAGKVYGLNPVSWMVDLARGMTPEIDWSHVDVTSNQKSYAISCIYCNPGTITAIEGVDEIARAEGFEFLLNRYKVGDKVSDVGNMTQTAYYLHVIADGPEQLVEKVKFCNDTLRILDQEGNDLLIKETEYDEIMASCR